MDIPINAIFHSYADRPDMSIQPELQELGLTPLGSSNMTIFQLEDTFGSFNLSEIEKLLDERFLSDNSSTLAPLDSDTNGNVSDYSETLKQLFDILAPPPELGVQQKLCASPLRISNIWLEMSVIVLTFCSLLVMAFCYTIILRKVSSRMDAQSRQSKKLIITTLIFVGAFVIWYAHTRLRALFSTSIFVSFPSPRLAGCRACYLSCRW